MRERRMISKTSKPRFKKRSVFPCVAATGRSSSSPIPNRTPPKRPKPGWKPTGRREHNQRLCGISIRSGRAGFQMAVQEGLRERLTLGVEEARAAVSAAVHDFEV